MVGGGGFAISDGTFYIEYLRRLFKWKPGDSEWTNTGLVDTGKQLNSELDKGFKLATLGETVYVGKLDGGCFNRLMVGTVGETSRQVFRFALTISRR